jgi:di/tricarboxylate transporter
MPIIVSALLGCLVLVLSKTITLQEAYEAVDWSVIILLAGVIPLGIAMEKTGLAAIIGQGVATFGAPLGPLFVLAGIYLATSILTEIMSNNSTAILMAPIAIATAEALAVSPMPFLMCVAYAGSASFMTPVGYQTNTMVYGPGGYRYGDFFRFGGPLQLVFMIIAVLLIPIFWPF